LSEAGSPRRARGSFRFVLEEPSPEDLDIAALQELRSVVYALLHAPDFTLDEAMPLIGRLAEPTGAHSRKSRRRQAEAPFRRHTLCRNCVIFLTTKHELTWIKIG
jgi:hypothetical protein